MCHALRVRLMACNDEGLGRNHWAHVEEVSIRKRYYAVLYDTPERGKLEDYAILKPISVCKHHQDDVRHIYR